jgi:hypothetical protein
MIHLATVCTRPSRYFGALLDSAREAGFEPVVLGAGLAWPGFGLKLRLEREYLETLRGKNVRVLFVDAHDVLIVRPREAIEAAFLALGQRAVASTEKLCYPDPWKESYYPEAGKPVALSSTPAGSWARRRLYSSFSATTATWSTTPATTSDGGRTASSRTASWPSGSASPSTRTVRFFSPHGKVSMRCSWGRTSRIRDENRPGVIHGNGGVDLDPIVAWLEAKRRCRRSPQALPSGRISIARR